MSAARASFSTLPKQVIANMYPIILIENPSEDDHAVIINGMNQYAAKFGMAGTGGYFFVARDDNNNIIAAISGFDNFGPAEIGGLWVDEKYRDSGYGTGLLTKAEEWARQKGCKAMTVFTLKNWPACGWYQRHGFVIEYERDGHANHSVGCFLIKKLTSA